MAPATISLQGILLLLLLGGSQSNDLVSLIDAREYFQARHIEATTAKMVELATARSAEGKDQVAQLLALRELGAHADKIKKAGGADDIRRQIEEVAQGQRGADLHGFAAEYARRTLRALGGEPPPGGGRVRSHLRRAGDAGRPEGMAGLEWFPASARLVASFHLGAPAAVDSAKGLRTAAHKLIPAKARAHLYQAIDKVGNVQVDRVSLAYSPDPQAPTKARFYARLTGKADRKRVLAFLKEELPDIKLEEPKGGRDAEVALIHLSATESGPGMALVGQTDFLLGTFEGTGPRFNHEELIGQMLAVRGKKEKGILEGKLAGALKNVPAGADGFVVGELPPDVRTGLTGGPHGFRVVPDNFVLHTRRGKDGLMLHLVGNTKDHKQAKRLAEDILRLKAKGLEGIKALPDEVRAKVPADDLASLTRLLESIQVEPAGAYVTARLTAPPEAWRLLLMLVGTPRTLGGPVRVEAEPSLTK